MTYPLQPIGPRPEPQPVAPIDKTLATERRRQRDEREQQQRRRRHDEPEGPPVADADGHIDVLA